MRKLLSGSAALCIGATALLAGQAPASAGTGTCRSGTAGQISLSYPSSVTFQDLDSAVIPVTVTARAGRLDSIDYDLELYRTGSSSASDWDGDFDFMSDGESSYSGTAELRASSGGTHFITGKYGVSYYTGSDGYSTAEANCTHNASRSQTIQVNKLQPGTSVTSVRRIKRGYSKNRVRLAGQVAVNTSRLGTVGVSTDIVIYSNGRRIGTTYAYSDGRFSTTSDRRVPRGASITVLAAATDSTNAASSSPRRVY